EEIKRDVPGLCESPLKSRIAAYKLGQTTIGAAGGLFTSSPQQLKQYLGNATECDIYPDAGDLLNRQVMRRWSAVIKMLQSWGVKVNIAWWGQVAKDSLDCDEITHQTIRYLSADDWLKDASKLRWQYESQQEIDKTQSLTYPVNLALNQRYLGDITDLIPQSGIVIVKSPKNTGKSVFTQQLIQRVSQQSYSIVSIVPRINLGREQAQRWDLQFINESVRIKILNDEGHAIDIEFRDVPAWRRQEIWQRHQKYLDCQTWEEAPETDKINLCWDSLLKLADRDFSKTVLILDECEQGLNHLLASSTCKDRRQQILATFEKIVKDSQLIIGLDADATDVSVDYLKALKPDGDIFVVVNSHPGSEWNCQVYRDCQLVYEQIFRAIASGQKIAIASDSQRECESLERKLLKVFPDLKIDRIDSKTTALDDGKFAIRHLNQHINSTQPQVLLYSPSLGTGVSIDTEYFDLVFGIFYGSINPSDARQMLARVRQNQDRIIWCSSYAQNPGCRAFDWRVMQSQMFEHHRDFVFETLMTEARQKTTEYSNDADLAPQMIEALQAMMEEGGLWNNAHIQAFAQFQARSNYHKSRLRDRLIEELEDSGHQVVYFDDDADDKAYKEAITEIKDELKRDEALAIAQAEDIPLETAEQLSRNQNLTPKGQAEVAKAFLKNELPELELTPEFVYKAVTQDRRGWLNAVKFWWALQNREKQQQKDIKRWQAHLKNLLAGGVAYLPDLRCWSKQLELIVASDLLSLIDLDNLDKEYSRESPEVQQFVRWCFEHRQQFKIHFNITIDEDTRPIKLINRLLAKLGLKLKQERKVRTRSGRLRLYRLDRGLLDDPDRHRVLAALDRAWEEAQNQAQIEGEFEDIAEPVPPEHPPIQQQAEVMALQALDVSGNVSDVHWNEDGSFWLKPRRWFKRAVYWFRDAVGQTVWAQILERTGDRVWANVRGVKQWVNLDDLWLYVLGEL
ncbi:MAG: plasmid replication protein, CyRepA1 family, partial [Jaaginema sp. PMC 1079.18]|nr:plasmid replication protein, CyRepA1 family [Jaaginema sp. PMC 1080.18]MEC4853279.1 plasmid replication protein, CyRepA1 family [Jaaginema sp. PMC 1079.18]MEC4868593.1 plasmid replication protein, CyRepA1 family [Jaaginema sp. PMC 1078.18]